MRLRPMDVQVPTLEPSYVRANMALAEDVITDLEDFRLLHVAQEDDVVECREAAQKLRHLLGVAAKAVASRGELRVRLISMRDACAEFVQASGGPDAPRFLSDQHYFESALRHLRRAIGLEASWIAQQFELTLDERLEPVLPAHIAWERV